MNREIKLKILKLVLIIVISVAVICALGMMLLMYQVEGETNLPFQVTKIIVVSSSEGIEKNNNENMWALDINQNNDIYVYIEKNEAYGRTEIIDNVKIDNIVIEREPHIGRINIYKPAEEATGIFNNIEQNQTSEIIYTGEVESNIKKMHISNQGGIVLFRCANDKVGEYVANEGNEINRNALLSTTGITSEQLRSKISFDITIDLMSKKKYRAQAAIEFPIDDIVNNQTTNLELTDLSDIVFKRIEN